MDKTKIKKIAKSATAGFLSALIGYGVGYCVTKAYTQQAEPVTQISCNSDSGGMVCSPESSSTMKLMATPLSATYSADEGVEAYSDDSYLLTATITPASAVNQEVDWAVDWQNSSSAFASGKTVTDYVTINPTVDGALTANLICKQAFGAKIVVTCTSRDNPEAKATCVLDYSQKIESVALKFGGITANLGGTTQIKYEINPNGVAPGGATEVTVTKSSVYTIEDSFNYSVKVNYTGLSDSHFALKGSTITGMPSGNKDITSDGLYFDYEHDVSTWFITTRAGDILFKNLSTAEIIDYFSEITTNTLFNVAVEVTGNYSNYSAQTLFTCAGYTNTASVVSVALGDASLVL